MTPTDKHFTLPTHESISEKVREITLGCVLLPVTIYEIIEGNMDVWGMHNVESVHDVLSDFELLRKYNSTDKPFLYALNRIEKPLKEYVATLPSIEDYLAVNEL